MVNLSAGLSSVTIVLVYLIWSPKMVEGHSAVTTVFYPWVSVVELLVRIGASSPCLNKNLSEQNC